MELNFLLHSILMFIFPGDLYSSANKESNCVFLFVQSNNGCKIP